MAVVSLECVAGHETDVVWWTDCDSVHTFALLLLATSDTWCVSDACSDTVVSTRSFKSSRNKPLSVSRIGIDLLIFAAKMVFLLVSMTAPMALRRAFEKRKGVDPGTIAIFNHRPCMGMASAWSLWRVP